jgi:DNA-binding MarR family transcriptional regulator
MLTTGVCLAHETLVYKRLVSKAQPQMDDLRSISYEVHILTAVIVKAARQSMEQHLAQLGTPLTTLQYAILRLLSADAFTLSELSRKMVLDPSTLVPALDALEHKGFIRRERDPSDRRRFPLVLTADGKVLLEQVQCAEHNDLLHQALIQLHEGDAEQLRTLLRRVVQQLPDGEANLKEIDERIAAQQTSTD